MNIDKLLSNDEIEKVEKLSEDDVIEIPQYENELRVKKIIEKDVGFKIRLEFLDKSIRNNTKKSLMAMRYGEGIYLNTENTNKGKVEYIKLK